MTDTLPKIPRNTKNTIDRANLGDIGAMFSLYDYYKNGKYSLPKDENKAQEYLEKVKDEFLSNRPYFDYLDITNFKGISNVRKKILLDPHLNVFVGVNGSGKTTIIEVLLKSMSWINNLLRSSSNGTSIDKDEINKSIDARVCYLTSSIRFDDKTNFELVLHKDKLLNGQSESKHVEFKHLVNIYKTLDELESGNFPYPLLSHYSVSRALEIKKEDTKIDKKNILKINKLDAYQSVTEQGRSFKDLIEWLAFYNKKDNNNEDYNIKSKLNQQLIAFEQVYSLFPVEVKETDYAKELHSKIKSLKHRISVINNNVDIENDSVKVVKGLLDKALGISNIRLDEKEENTNLLLDKNNITISALDLSHGEKALFCLLSGIAKNLVLANPQNENNPLDGFGVVLIDEIDLHLHPLWQQLIVSQLTDNFKNIQFILTTHSPQVLTTVPDYCIKIIDKDKDGQVSISSPDFSLGSESNDLLTEIMKTDPRPQNVDVVKLLNDYTKLIKDNNWDSTEAIELESKLKNHKGIELEMKKLQMDIRLRKRRLKGTQQ